MNFIKSFCIKTRRSTYQEVIHSSVCKHLEKEKRVSVFYSLLFYVPYRSVSNIKTVILQVHLSSFPKVNDHLQ